jgi:uncharacterized membrane protein YphA (DoxX/SURF4 family)/peroxiredoxin
MGIALLAARLLLAIVFLIAGLAKLVSRKSTVEMLRDFQVPQPMIAPAAIAVPAAELLASVLLLIPSTVIAGGVVASLLLTSFILVISANLVRGRRPSCQCFGTLSARPVGTATLVRNGALLLVALALVIGPRAHDPVSVFGSLSALTYAERVSALIALASFVISGATLFIVMQLVAQHGRLLVALDALGVPPAVGDAASAQLTAASRLGMAAGSAARSGTGPATQPGLAPGSRVPEFTLRDVAGRPVSSNELRGISTLLLFSDPNCGPCNALLPTVAEWQSALRDRLRVVVVSTGALDANRAKARDHQLAHVWLQEQQEVQSLFGAYGTPGAVLVAADGTIASRVAQGRDDILALVKRFAEGSSQQPLPPAQPTAAANRAPAPRPPAALPMGTSAPVRPLLDLFGHSATPAYSRKKRSARVGGERLGRLRPAHGIHRESRGESLAWHSIDDSAGSRVRART